MFSLRLPPFALSLVWLFLAVRTLAYYPQGTITVPANGTALKPGQAFNFTFNARGDYCLSSYNYTVYLFTEVPSGNSLFIGSENQVATGYYLGRFAASTLNNPYPSNRPPPQLVMPDFSKSPGGFASGATASDKQVYLTVVDEWGMCEGALGTRFSLTYNTLVYNATQ